MRMSDWSSYVFSADLLVGSVPHSVPHYLLRIASIRSATCWHDVREVRIRVRGGRDAAVAEPSRHLVQIHPRLAEQRRVGVPTSWKRWRGSSGRRWSRERVCQSVKNTGAAESSK